MKKSLLVCMMAAAGLLGWCSRGKIESDADKPAKIDEPAKIDTALVLGAWQPAHRRDAMFLLVKRDGTTAYTSSMYRIRSLDFSNVGDTVIVATDKYGDINIIKNLTMENKIKAFSKQR